MNEFNEKTESSYKTIAILGVEYEEFNTKSYSGVTISINGQESKVNTGIFEEDYLAATEQVKDKVDAIFNASSVDNFITDVKNNL